MLVGRGCALGLVGAHHPDISEQKIVGLHAVLPGNNWVAFTLSGAYTVDWGDGTTENFAAGVTAYRNLAWSSYNTSTLTARGYRQAIITITPQSGHNITSWNFLVKHNQPVCPMAIRPAGWTCGSAPTCHFSHFLGQCRAGLAPDDREGRCRSAPTR